MLCVNNKPLPKLFLSIKSIFFIFQPAAVTLLEQRKKFKVIFQSGLSSLTDLSTNNQSFAFKRKMHNVSKRKLQQRSLKNLLTRFFNKEKIERYFDQRLDPMVKIVRLFCCQVEMMLELRVLVSTVQVLGQTISQLKGPGFRSTSRQMFSSFSFP